MKKDPAQRLWSVLLGIFVLVATTASSVSAAATSPYYDFGPYYNKPQILGFSFSVLENLPALTIPKEISLPKADGILPGSPLYPFEKLVENVQLATTFDPIKKEELRLTFATERLAEAKTLMDTGQTEAAAVAVADYGNTISTIAQSLTTFSQRNDPQTATLADKVEQTVSSHAILSQSFGLSSVPVAAENWAAASEATKNVLDEVAEVKKEPAMPEALSADIQKLKEGGLITDEESNKLYSLKERSKVRDELTKLASSGQFPVSELASLDTAVAQRYPDVYKQQEANLQVAELRTYQTLPQPDKEMVEAIADWQKDPSTPPPNEIKPYLWYNRALDLASEVNLTNFTPTQQEEVAKLYPDAITDNPSYTPPSPTPTGAPSPSPTPPTETTTNETANQTANATANLTTNATTNDTTNATTNVTTNATTNATATAAPSPTPLPYLAVATGPLPGEPTYIFKRLGEQIGYTFTIDKEQKANLLMQQAERRLAESQALAADPKKAKDYEATIKTYTQTMANAADYIKQFKDPEQVQQTVERFETQAARHEAAFEKGMLPVVKDPKLIADAIRATEDAMDASSDVLDRPALPPVLSSRLQDLKAQGLILPEEVDDLTRSDTREEVREKIRKLVEIGTFPPADAKKLDEAQLLSSPAEYNQLVEVRKVEELQNLRNTQAEFAQTATLRSTANSLSVRESTLVNSIDLSLIKPEDLAGRKDLLTTFQTLTATASARPLNNGQFGADVTAASPSSKLATTPPGPSDAVLTTCPDGATFKAFEGCVWADNGRRINDYEQYKCEGTRQYYSFAARKCVPYEPGAGFQEDAQPVCPVGYTWTWQVQSCTATTGGILPYPSPSPEPTPADQKELEERSKSCPTGATYKPPQGCVWDDSGESVYNQRPYRCKEGSYYSFEKFECIPNPKEGESPKDAAPQCKESDTFWHWRYGRCISYLIAEPVIDYKEPEIPKPFLATPDSPLYFIKQAGENARLALAFSEADQQKVRLAQAKERLAEGFYAVGKDNSEAFKKALSAYTAKMQEIYNDLSKATLSPDAKKAIGDVLSQEAVSQNLLLQKAEILAKDDTITTAITAAVSATVLGVDKAADLAGEPVLPADIKEKIEALPADMIPEEEKKILLAETDTRVEARLAVGKLVASGILAQKDGKFLNEDFEAIAPNAKYKVEELKKLEEITTIADKKDDLVEKVEKNEEIVAKLTEFQNTFEPGKEVPAEIRPYVRLTRINEVAQTIRPDIVRISDFSNRKDVVLAVATLQEEFRPTRDALRQVEDFRRRNPNAPLPFELARIEALSFSLGVRDQTGPCYLPSPPFAPNTPCPPAGAPIPINSYYNPGGATFNVGGTTYTVVGDAIVDVNQLKQGEPTLTYGQGPAPTSPGVCPDGYHWMYDTGGWCMSNSGNYSSSYTSGPGGYPGYPGSSGPSGPGYTPYSPYYTAPGTGPGSPGYYTSPGFYSPPSYWGPAPSIFSTTPPSGTVPGTGPAPTAPGQCPVGFHWMPPAGDTPGWCMADGPTYVSSGSTNTYCPPPSYWSEGARACVTSESTLTSTPPSGGFNCGSQAYNPATGKCGDGACPGGYAWDGTKCAVQVSTGPYYGSSGGSYYSPNVTQSSCGPGYYWDGKGCIPSYSTSQTSGGTSPYSTSPSCSYPSSGCGSNSYFDWAACSCRQYTNSPGGTYYSGYSGGTCTPPSAGCGSGNYWDNGTCSCRSGSSSPSNYCQGLSCGGGSYLDYSTCTCKPGTYSGSSSGGTYSGGSSSGSSSSSCSYPSGGCPGGWFDWGRCSCQYSSTSSGGSTTSTSGSTSTSSSGGSSSGSCPSGYHWMSDNGGWCMQDGGGSSGGSSSGSSGGSTGTTTPSSPPPSSSTSTGTSSPPSSPPPSGDSGGSSSQQSSPPPPSGDSGSSSSSPPPPSSDTSSSSPPPPSQ